MSLNIQITIISRCSDPDQVSFYIDRINSYQIGNNGTTNTKVITPTNSQSETSLLISNDCLNLTSGWYNLIIYDWAMSTLDTTEINSIIESILNLNQNVNPWSAAYIGKFMDTCTKYNPFTETGSNSQFSIVENSEPAGFNAVLLTHDMSQSLHSKLTSTDVAYYSINYALQDIGIDNTSIKYIALSPNLFTYDPLFNKVDISKVYAVKSNECVGTTTEVTPPSDNDLTFFWILLIIIGVGLIIWFIITTQNESIKIKTKSSTYNP
jgi:hypothetical protein